MNIRGLNDFSRILSLLIRQLNGLKTFVAPFLPTRLTAPWVSEDEDNYILRKMTSRQLRTKTRISRNFNISKNMLVKVGISNSFCCRMFSLVHYFQLPHEKFLRFDWLGVVLFQLNLKYLHVKISRLFTVPYFFVRSSGYSAFYF